MENIVSTQEKQLLYRKGIAGDIRYQQADSI